jgi:hypothetical protein
MPTTVVNMKTDDFDVYIGRPSILGNPFAIGKDGDRKEVLEKYEKYFLERVENDPIFRKAVMNAKGKVLGCFCKPLDCHGDVIAKWVDSQEK